MQNRIDLAPARWIWAPYRRTLPNTFVLFKKVFTIEKNVKQVRGMITACSRYTLNFNGERIQFGPAPCDPRFEEVDPFDLTQYAHIGDNELIIRVLYYGHGEGTWVSGRGGLLYRIDIEYKDGSAEAICSDETTLFAPDESHPAGQYKRWYLRSLQEEYDARRDNPVYAPSKVLPGRSDKPSSLNGGSDYLYDGFPAEPDECCLRERTILMPKEVFIPAERLVHASVIRWNYSTDDWFRFGREDCFRIEEDLQVLHQEDSYTSVIPEDRSVCMTFKMPEGGCGFIDFEIVAPEGTIVEAIVQEGHNPDNTRWLDNHFNSWTRFICREGYNHFISFDYECYAWLQLHIHGAAGAVTVRRPGMLRRLADTPEADWYTDDPCINRILSAVENTLKNSAVETFVDGMSRERQQYSGDCNPQVDLFGYLYGADHAQIKRFYLTYGDGLSKDGYFIDSWPAYDRINRLGQLQTGMTSWPVILDHSLIFVASYCRWRYQSGDHSLDENLVPKFLRLIGYLETLPHEGALVDPAKPANTFFWIDHISYASQKDKQCAVNLLIVDMLENLAPLLKDTGYSETAEVLLSQAVLIRSQLIRDYYDAERKLIFDNRAAGCVSDYTLSLAVLLDMLPDTKEAARVLREEPAFLKIAYPANAVWRIRALGKLGDCKAITRDLHNRWSGMASLDNNTLQEFWSCSSDTTDEWSHCPIAPGLAIYECYGGLKCEAEGFSKFSVSADDGGLAVVHWTASTASGKISYQMDNGSLTLSFPENMQGFIRMRNGRLIRAVSGEKIRVDLEDTL